MGEVGVHTAVMSVEVDGIPRDVQSGIYTGWVGGTMVG